MENQVISQERTANEMKKANLPRLHYLDWLKTLAVWLVVFVHVIYYLNLLNIGITRSEKEIVKQMIVFFSEFGMPIFFYVSGRASFLSSTSSLSILLRKKILRLALPLISGYFILLPITHYVANGRRPCTYTLDGTPANFYLYYLMYVKDFKCHGFEWLWFLALLIVISLVMFPFIKVMKDQKRSENIAYIISCGCIAAIFGPIVIYSYDFHPLALFGLSFPLMIMLVSSLVMRSARGRKSGLNVALIYLTATSFILGSLFLAFYSNVDYKSSTSVISSDEYRPVFPEKGFLRVIDDRRMMLAIIFYISFYSVGFIDQLLSHYCSSNEQVIPENQALIGSLEVQNSGESSDLNIPMPIPSSSQEDLPDVQACKEFKLSITKNHQTIDKISLSNDYNYYSSDKIHSIINNMPGMFKPTLIFISLVLYSISFSLGNNGIGYMWAFPMYRIPSSSLFYVAGSWIIVFVLDSICHSLLNHVFVPKLYFHFTASSIIIYIVHMLWLEVTTSYIIIPLQIPYLQSIFLTFTITTILSIATYILATKVKFIGFIVGLTTAFTSGSNSNLKKNQISDTKTKTQQICV
ncbi:protein with 12x transmembrane regions [Cryptosporidium sp. chipmunk genotype I]|uniref:protein with 12x transmembrane regions n=1 Tax=Cryptosporidium sp. chipmunk genotype I TaxID=1280935 RepID=UPI00351A93A0|nr:protein with 12x transmembrane regions [Cryptosporidium sp. chipmunk genotype I]